MGGSDARVVFARFTQAEGAIHGEPHIAGIGVFLPIVLPPADRAQSQRAGVFERSESTTRAAKTSLHGFPHDEPPQLSFILK
jgi:hypothetical protein